MSGKADIPRRIALVVNDASGSYSPEAVEALRETFASHDIEVARCITVPEDDVPSGDELDADGIEYLAVFAGDGTISRTVKTLDGWGGAVLPLPGGTMNLLCGRLHGEDASEEEIVARVAKGDMRLSCEPVVRQDDRQSLVGVSCGPGVHWYHVREAMRHATDKGGLGELVDETGEAMDLTLNGPMVVCRTPQVGRDEGYALIELEPEEDGIHVIAYTAQDFGGYLKQGLAMILRKFREGPHERLCRAEEVTIAALEGGKMELSFDGEPVDGAASETFRLERCPVRLVVTGT